MLSGGSPTDDHGVDANITLRRLTEAANSPSAACSLNQAAENIRVSLLKIEGIQEVAIDADGGAIDAVMKALAAPGAPKRYVLGVAYPAQKADGHGEWMNADEIELAAWNYARNHRQIGFYHADGTLGHADLVESYVYRGPDWATTDISGQEQVIKAGDWLMGAILDEPGFDLVRRGKADGWSVDGVARRRRPKSPKESKQ